MSLFEAALSDMKATGAWYRKPQSFKAYLAENGLGTQPVAQNISIDSISRLNQELRDSGVMVFRLGSEQEKTNTRFALAKSQKSDLSDYFLIDQQLFSRCKPQPFVPKVSRQLLLGFKLLPRFTETSLINLAVYSGLLSHALELDESTVPSAPVTGQSTYTFDVKPRSMKPLKWKHYQGQVEVDAVLCGQRQGRPVAIIVEAKSSQKFDSLAHHKLLYPYWALKPNIPENMETSLVYLRTLSKEDGYHFYIAECDLSGDREALDGLSAKRCRHLVLNI